jgi:hypothetical protein
MRDDEYDWIEVTKFGGQPQYVRGACHHVRRTPVESVLGEVVAQLCLSCDEQLPVGWASPYDLPAPELEWRELP